MGVWGLTTLLENNNQIFQDIQFRNSKLVIDGYNLIHLLYLEAGLDQNRGGEYFAFAKLVERFVAALRKCDISPYVLLDGRASNKKQETSVKRAEARIKRANQAATTGNREGILPPLVSSVLVQTLAQLKVPLAQCYREADQEIGALAIEWHCPVLTNDSDFYIFQLPGGKLPDKHFQWQQVKTGEDARSYIPCKIYFTSRFCSHFTLRPELLPAFAILGGNDYVKLPEFSWSLPNPSGKSRLENLLDWLKDFMQPDEALEEALRLLGERSEQNRNDLRSRMTTAMKEYQTTASVTKSFFSHGGAPQLPLPEKDLVPDWMRLPLFQGRLVSQVLDVLVTQRIILTTVVESAKLPSSNLTSRPIRQLTYGLLLGGESELKVTEMGRASLKVKPVAVNPRVPRTTRRLPLASLHEADRSVRLKFLLEALGVSEASLSEQPPERRLPVAVTYYWLRNARPPPNRQLLGALMQEAPLLRGNPPDVNAALAFNQWQMCLRDAMDLNQLLSCPLEQPEVACLFQGTLVRHLLSRLDVQ